MWFVLIVNFSLQCRQLVLQPFSKTKLFQNESQFNATARTLIIDIRAMWY